MINRRQLATIPIAATLAACGAGSGGSHVDARAVLLSAVQRVTTTSFHADVTANASLDVTGPAAAQLGTLNGQTLAFSVKLDVQNKQRAHAEVGLTAGGQTFNVIAVLYDGAAYVSTDGGKSFKAVPIGNLPSSSFGPESALQYLESAGTVTDVGPGTADGVAVENYHATLDSAKITALIKKALSGLNSGSLSQVLSSVKFTGGHLDASVDHAGHIVADSCAFNGSMDFGSLDPSLTGTTMTFAETATGHFRDYGSSITVLPPANVTGTTTLP
ncbi:MAG TPA: hypothetical protein VNY76_04280 [Candidatus Acidoferrales bacterium]|jgi:hypothetical protein|nr:hypothetical protein [Candidatus Acidoferrales bacterium]